MTQPASLDDLRALPWVILDWGVVRSIGRSTQMPVNLVTVLVDGFAREAATASNDYPGIDVVNQVLGSLTAPHPVAVAHEWHSFNVDSSEPTSPLEPQRVADIDLTMLVRSNLVAGRPAFDADAGARPSRTVKDHWQKFVEQLRPHLASAEATKQVQRMTHNILEEPHELVDYYAKALPDQISQGWKDAIAKHPGGYPKFLFFAAMLFYLSEFASKNRTKAKAIENDFDDIHYLVLAGVTGNLCTAESSGGEGVARLPDAARHMFGDRVRIWTPDQWQQGA